MTSSCARDISRNSQGKMCQGVGTLLAFHLVQFYVERTRGFKMMHKV